MTRTAPAHHQRQQAHLVIERVLRRLRRDDYDLAARAAVERPDGYPTGSNGGRGNEVSNPTLNAVIAREGRPGPDGRPKQGPATTAIALMMQAAELLGRADSLRASALPPVAAPEPEDWCTNCAKAGTMTARGTEKDVGKDNTLCHWCHSFNREHGQLPPRSLVRKHASGTRIYDRDVTAALRASQPDKAR